MLPLMRKVALFSCVSLMIVSGSARGQSRSNPNGNPVVSGNSSTLQANAVTNSNTNVGTTSPQQNLSPEQLKQQIQAEMARMAKDMIVSFDQNGDKALNETELQEALVALTNMMRGHNQQSNTSNNSRLSRGQLSNRSNPSNTATGNTASGNTALGNVDTNTTVPTDDNPARKTGRRR